MELLTAIMTILLVLTSVALIGLILIQRGKGGGLAGAFGGGGVEQAFGTHATTMAQKTTAVLGILFLVLTIVLAKLYAERPGPRLPPGGAPASHEGHTQGGAGGSAPASEGGE